MFHFCSFSKLHVFPHGIILAFLQKFWFNTLSVTCPSNADDNLFDRFLQTACDRLEGCCRWDVLNFSGFQFFEFKLTHSMRSRCQKVFFLYFLRNVFDPLWCHMTNRPHCLEVKKMDKATTEALFKFPWYSLLVYSLFSLAHIKSRRNGLGMKMAWRNVLCHRASFPYCVKCFIFPFASGKTQWDE